MQQSANATKHSPASVTQSASASTGTLSKSHPEKHFKIFLDYGSVMQLAKEKTRFLPR